MGKLWAIWGLWLYQQAWFPFGWSDKKGWYDEDAWYTEPGLY